MTTSNQQKKKNEKETAQAEEMERKNDDRLRFELCKSQRARRVAALLSVLHSLPHIYLSNLHEHTENCFVALQEGLLMMHMRGCLTFWHCV